MKIEFTDEWCVRMARLEIEVGSQAEAGSNPTAASNAVQKSDSSADSAFEPSNIAFGRFVRLMRRDRGLTLERLAAEADIDIPELVEIEENHHHKPEPRTVYQLAAKFKLPVAKMMQLAGLSVSRDTQLYEAAIRFAARSEPVKELNTVERAALEAFVSVLSEKK